MYRASVVPAQPVVESAAGKLRGFERDGVRTFLGIPYAAPADGANRFRPPQPVAPWSGIRDAISYGPRCPVTASAIQPVATPANAEDAFLLYRGITTSQSSEDCLRLNVWAPAGEGRRPVMVYMHGGAFFGGSGNDLIAYDGHNLAAGNDVVVVTHNHRLNVFGFLDLSSFGGRWADCANVGMQDNLAVLRWVHENAEAFGGDPGNVTIFGQSGGGGKVLALMAMPAARGLFHRAIVQSGVLDAMSPLCREESREVAEKALAAMDVPLDDLDRLGDLPVPTICGAALTGGLFGWRPVADGTVMHSADLDESLAPGVPLLVGTVLNELTNPVDNPLREGFDDAALLAECTRRYGDRGGAIAAAYRAEYPERTALEILCAIDAAGFRSPSFDVADRKFALDGLAWQYLFAWRTPVLDGRPKTFHSCEIAFVFGNAGLCSNQTGGGDDALVLGRTMSDAWVAFARTGDPSTRALPWPAFTPDHPTMVFDDPSQVRLDPEAEGRRLLRDTPAR